MTDMIDEEIKKIEEDQKQHLEKKLIVDFLKENKKKGIAYMFYPELVRDWIVDNWGLPKLKILNDCGKWVAVNEFLSSEVIDFDNIVFTLDYDYGLSQEEQGEYVEFEIRNGFFKYLDWSFQWLEYVNFLQFIFRKIYNEQLKGFDNFTDFGGWQYEGSESWFMTPRLAVISPNLTIYQDNYNPNNYAECECKPATPIKIRFWRRKQCDR